MLRDTVVLVWLRQVLVMAAALLVSENLIGSRRGFTIFRITWLNIRVVPGYPKISGYLPVAFFSGWIFIQEGHGYDRGYPRPSLINLGDYYYYVENKKNNKEKFHLLQLLSAFTLTEASRQKSAFDGRITWKVGQTVRIWCRKSWFLFISAGSDDCRHFVPSTHLWYM